MVAASTKGSVDEARSLANFLMENNESLNKATSVSGPVPSVAQLLKTLEQENELQINGIRGTFTIQEGEFITGVVQSHGRYLPVIGCKDILAINGKLIQVKRYF